MKNKTLSRLFNLIRKSGPVFIVSLLLSAVFVLVSLYIPIISGRAIDAIIKYKSLNNEVRILVIKIAVYSVIAALIQWLIGISNNRLAYTTIRDLRNQAVYKLYRVPVSFMDSHTPGDIISRIVSDADQVSDGLILGLTQLFSGILTIFITFVYMFMINPKLAPVVIILTPMSLIIARFIARRSHSYFKQQTEARGSQTELIEESVTNRKVITNYSAEKEFINKFEESNNRYASSSLKAIFLSSLTNPSTRFVNNIIYALVGTAGAINILAGSGVFTIGSLTCFLNYSAQYAKPFNEISGVIAELQNAMACAERLFEIIDADEETETGCNTVSDISDGIDFENVDFSYDKSRKIISNFNLHALNGQKIAIVGPTGCGKTTLINLLLRFYDPDSGSIKINNQDISELSRKSLRNIYGLVLQDSWIKTGTVKDNISMTKPDSTDEDIINAAKMSHCHSFISKLPQGYDTVISNDYSGLSQGQKQLLCIARMMLILPEVLILDEATSSIDTRTEIKIREAFSALSENKTSFVVAHRLNTIKNSDLILVMQNGKIIEQGTHSYLIGLNGLYTKMYNSKNI